MQHRFIWHAISQISKINLKHDHCIHSFSLSNPLDTIFSLAPKFLFCFLPSSQTHLMEANILLVHFCSVFYISSSLWYFLLADCEGPCSEHDVELSGVTHSVLQSCENQLYIWKVADHKYILIGLIDVINFNQLIPIHYFPPNLDDYHLFFFFCSPICV